MVDPIPRIARAGAFAAGELMLDLFRLATEHYRMDIEAVWILVAIGVETSGPWILDPVLADKYMCLPERIPDEMRGAVSRRRVAERTGLPRETVRRRIAELMDRGYVSADGRGRVQLTGERVLRQDMHAGIYSALAAVERYRARLAELGVDVEAEAANALRLHKSL